jgi:hypothetical protein
MEFSSANNMFISGVLLHSNTGFDYLSLMCFLIHFKDGLFLSCLPKITTIRASSWYYEWSSLKTSKCSQSFSGSSHTNHDSFSYNTTYIWPCMMHHVWYIFFCAVQKQTTTAYCIILSAPDHHVCDIFVSLMNHDILSYRALPTLDHHVWYIFSGSSDTNNDSLLQFYYNI